MSCEEHIVFEDGYEKEEFIRLCASERDEREF